MSVVVLLHVICFNKIIMEVSVDSVISLPSANWHIGIDSLSSVCTSVCPSHLIVSAFTSRLLMLPGNIPLIVLEIVFTQLNGHVVNLQFPRVLIETASQELINCWFSRNCACRYKSGLLDEVWSFYVSKTSMEHHALVVNVSGKVFCDRWDTKVWIQTHVARSTVVS